MQLAPTSTPYWSSSVRVYRPVHRVCKRWLLHLLCTMLWQVYVVIPFGCQYVSFVRFVRGLWVRRTGTAVSLGTSFVDRVPPNSTIWTHAYSTFCWLLLTSWLLPVTLLCYMVSCITHKNRRLADRRRKLIPVVHRYVVGTVRDSLCPPSRVACHFPLYISILLTIFLPLLPVLFRIHSLFIEWHEQAFRAVSWIPWSPAFPTPRGNTDPRYFTCSMLLSRFTLCAVKPFREICACGRYKILAFWVYLSRSSWLYSRPNVDSHISVLGIKRRYCRTFLI